MSTETDTQVVAEVRENFGKGYARRLRAAGQIPAVIYGHGTDPVHVSLPGHQVLRRSPQKARRRQRLPACRWADLVSARDVCGEVAGTGCGARGDAAGLARGEPER